MKSSRETTRLVDPAAVLFEYRTSVQTRIGQFPWPVQPVHHLQLTRLQAGLALLLLGHDTQYMVPALFTQTRKYVPLGYRFQLQESFACASAAVAIKAAKQTAVPIKI
jgi:hypothetical protein